MKCLPIFVCLLSAVVLIPTAESEENAKQEIDFASQIQPIFRKNCYSCHGAEIQESGLRLDVKQRAFQGGDLGAAIVRGDSSTSRLIDLVKGTDEAAGIMPPEGEGTPLTSQEISLLRNWIDQGAIWPDDADRAAAGSEHWSFQPIQRPALPNVQNRSWPRNAIDYFILARLEESGIRPSPQADRPTLIRRLYLDLLGLPPTPQEVDDFVNDARSDAYDRLVDRILKSAHYGERWGRHWLDLARYADTDGYEKDRPRPHAWRYRQWVIDALNADMPFDRFSIEQLAGDMLPHAKTNQLVAVGFHRNTLHNTEGGTDKEEDRVKKTIDRTNTFGTTWLGLTVGCAQCHSHKYDPLTQREYYSLYAFFNYIEEKDVPAPAVADEKDPQAQSVVQQPLKTRDTRVFPRGDFLRKKEGVQVEADVPAVLPPLNTDGKSPDRLDVAWWLFRPDNPLTPRVMVNRIWQRYFGRGVVGTSDDFGAQGDPPSHPQLLDWLASEFRDSGWRLKQIHRLIVMSAAYRQSSAARPDLHDVDPENALLARQTRRRVEAEIVRDLTLAVSGLLDPHVGGPSVRPPQPAEYSKLTYANSAKWAVSKGGDRYRRGLYTFFQRTSPYPMLMTFDSPDSIECTAKRSQSNTPLQALTLWNDPVFVECAQQLGRRIVNDVPATADPEQTVRDRAAYAFQLCLARKPTEEELAAVVELFDEQTQLSHADEMSAAAIVGKSPIPDDVSVVELSGWVAVGRALINLDEFITRE